MRKRYASQESVQRTLTNEELAAPFRVPPPDPQPLPAVTREGVLSDDAGVVARVRVDRAVGRITILAGGGP